MIRVRSLQLVLAVFLVTATGCISSQSQNVAKVFTLQEDFSGSGFFKHFVFDSIPDPTHGYVSYVDNSAALKHRPRPLTYINTSGHAIIAADSASVASKWGREAVRLKSVSSFTTGLVIVDVIHMPEGMGTWPAFWSFGPKWPSSGEIDLIEGVNNHSVNTMTLHTDSGCLMPNVGRSSQMTGTFSGNLNCSTTIGCASLAMPHTFGPTFNRAGGAVFALLWTDKAIQIWIWPHNVIPTDVSLGEPSPEKWGTPASNFPLGKICGPEHFKSHNLIINTTFCGSWAGTEYPGGLRACESFVRKNPAAFAKAFWEIATLRLYHVPL